MKFSLLNRVPGETGAYAERELCEILALAGAQRAESGAEGDLSLVLELDPCLAAYSYSVSSCAGTVTLAGPTPAEALSAVYLMLERIGFFFDTDGVHLAGAADFSRLAGYAETVAPFVRLRGIRQHINFPMDISSYHPEDARAYIRSLARMRMKAITFHSYDNMWCGKPGHFFYGLIHDIPKDEGTREVIEGQEKFVIPECEPLLGDEAAVAAFAVDFLRDLMHTAKVAGLHITMSVEPDEDTAKLKKLLHDYPEIDELELITPELGVFGQADYTYAEALQEAKELFGEEIFSPDGTLEGLDPAAELPPRLRDTLEALSRSVKLYERRDAFIPTGRALPIRIGLYVLCRGSLYIAKRIMDKVLPPDMTRTYLPAHGTDAVVDAARTMRFDPADFQKSVLYSWIEFDGNMYLQQNSTRRFFIRWSTCGRPPVRPRCKGFNHWRTAENRLPIAYSAYAAERRMTPEAFYTLTAQRFGLLPAAFASAMHRSCELDVFAHDWLFNIGFCYLPCWTMHPGIGWCDLWDPEKLAQARRECGALVNAFVACTDDMTTPDGRELIAFLVNRYESMCAHLDLIAQLLRIRPICGNDNRNLTDADRDGIAAALGGAETYLNLYLHTYAERVPDRGSQGQIVDYCNTMRGYLTYLRGYYLGVPTGEVVRAGENAPPPPDAQSATQGRDA